MSFPPSFIQVRFGARPTLWLPLLLLWPLLPLVFGLCGLALFILPGSKLRAYACLSSLWQLLCATRGTRVVVHALGAHYCVSVH